MDELKPCPFCGGEAKISHYDNRSAVICMSCLNQTGAYDDCNDAKAIIAWNRRAVPGNKPLTLEEFERECDLQRKSGKERWLWCVDEMEEAWYRVSGLSKFANITNYGKTWLAYAHKPEN